MRGEEWLINDRSGEQPIDPKAITRQLRDRQRSVPLNKRSGAPAVLLLAGGEWTPRDLRRTAATLMGELGVRPDVIERTLNHIEQNRMSRIYQRQSLEAEQQAAWRKLGERLEPLI
jgi:integrase